MAAKRPIEIEKPFLTDEQWEKISVHLPKPKSSRRGGQKPVDHRPVVERLLWMLRNGSRWKDLPKYYPSASTCWRRLDEWEEKGVWVKIWHTFLGELNESGRLDWEEAFADASFAPAKKKRGDGIGKTKKGEVTKWMVVVDGQGIPVASLLESATLAEVTLLEPTLAKLPVLPENGRKVPVWIRRLVLDRAYDSDPLSTRLLARGIELIFPHRKNRKKTKTQDGRKLRRNKRRWKVERTFSWLGSFRRLLVKYEHILSVYQRFFQLACVFIILMKL